MIRRCFVLGAMALAGWLTSAALAQDPAPLGEIRYLGNEAVMITGGGVKILVDPLFDDDFGGEDFKLPNDLRIAVMAAEPPYDGIDAIFITQALGNHFSAMPLLAYLSRHRATRLVAPTQALEQLTAQMTPADAGLAARFTPVILGPDDPLTTLDLFVDDLTVEAQAVPHVGEAATAGLSHVVYRFTLGDAPPVVHLAETGPDRTPFERHYAGWLKVRSKYVLAPYWLFSTPQGLSIVQGIANAEAAVAFHLNARAHDNPAETRARFPQYDLFLEPGETRDLEPLR